MAGDEVTRWATISRSMQRRLFASLGIAAALGCTAVLSRQEGQCQTHGDCQVLDPRYVCGEGGVCVVLSPFPASSPPPMGAECRGDMDCEATAAVCRDGFCRPVVDPNGRCVLLDATRDALTAGADVMLIGLLSSREELGLDESTASERALQPIHGVGLAVSTALAELNRARADGQLSALPPLVAVACDERDGGALEYLLDTLRVRTILGPSNSDRVELALVRSSDKVLLIPPFADGPNLDPSPSDTPGFLLSCRPNRRGVLPYFLDAVAEARTLFATRSAPDAAASPALVVSSDVATASFADGVDDGALAAMGVRRLRYNDLTGRDLTTVLAEADPPVDLVIAASIEDDWPSIIARHDASYFARQGTYPYYLLADKRPNVYARMLTETSTDSRFAPQHERVLGLDYQRGAQSALAQTEFTNAFLAQTGRSPEPAAEYAYDCTYVAVYAALAAALRLRQSVLDLTPEGIVIGLRALQGGGPALLVGARDATEVLSALVASEGMDGAVDLIGASGELDFQIPADDVPGVPIEDRRYFHVSAPNGQLYCVDANSKLLCDTGIVFPTAGGPPLRSDTSCACLRAGQP